MKERPILFSTPMVQAILAGRKTQTRRILKPQLPIDAYEINLFNPENWRDETHAEKGIYYWSKPGLKRFPKLPYGLPGDQLWVRETWNQVWECISGKNKGQRYCKGDTISGQSYSAPWYEYAAGPFKDEEPPKWKPSIHMPRIASRILLEVCGIRVERLHDISEEDILMEGVRIPTHNGNPIFRLGLENSALNFMPEGFNLRDGNDIPFSERDYLFAHYAELWCKINGRESWDSNPWVWVIAFKVIKPWINSESINETMTKAGIDPASFPKV